MTRVETIKRRNQDWQLRPYALRSVTPRLGALPTARDDEQAQEFNAFAPQHIRTDTRLVFREFALETRLRYSTAINLDREFVARVSRHVTAASIRKKTVASLTRFVIQTAFQFRKPDE